MAGAAKQETRAAILDAAWELLAEHPSGDFGLEQVAKGASVSRQTVYAHFANRAELLVAVVERYKQDVGYDVLAQPLLAAETAVDALAELVRFYVAFMPPVARLHIAIDLERARDPLLEKSFSARESGRHQYAHHVATRLAAEGRLAEAWTVGAAADMISACTSAAFVVELLERRGWTTDELGARLLQLFTDSFVGEPARTPTAPKTPGGATR